MAITVTATQGGSPANGMGLQVLVITGAKTVTSQTGGSAGTNIASGTTYTLSITTTQANSRVYGSGSVFSGTVSSVAAAATTILNEFLDSANTDNYITWKATSLTGTPGATTLGYTNSSNTGGAGPSAYEVLVAAALAEDGSAPPFVHTTSATAVTTASFTPPGGSLLVALVAANGGAGAETMTLSDNTLGGLNWTEKARNTAGAGNDYTGVWIADVPAAGGPAQLPQRQRFRKRQVLQRSTLVPSAVSGSVQPWPTVPVPRRRPARAVVEFTPVTTTNKPVGVVQPWATVPIRRRQLQRAVAAHVYGVAFVKVPAPIQGPYLPPRRVPGRAVWRGSAPFLGFVAVPAPLQQPGPAPRRRPSRAVVEFTPVTTANAAPAVPVSPLRQPRPAPRRIPGRAVVQFTPVTTTNAAPAFVAVPAPRQQPGPAPRRKPGRAVVQFTPVTTTNSTAAAPSGTIQPWATVPIRRRQLQRAVIAHAYGTGYVAVPAPRQSPYLPPRRTQARATIAHAYGSAFVAVPAPRQQPGPAPRRKPGRAVVQFRPVRTTNGTAAVTAVLRQGDYDHKSWIKKRWILRL